LWQPVHRAAARELCSSGQGLRRSIRHIEGRRKRNNFLGREGGENDQGLTEAKETVPSDSVAVDTIVYLGEEEGLEHLIYTEPETDRWELHDFMLQAMSCLPVRERLVIGWLYGLGNECLSVSEVAERMRVSPGEVRRIKQRALDTLKKVIADEKSGWIE
jgi:RNA polymerase sigma factor (sigma-70 family)